MELCAVRPVLCLRSCQAPPSPANSNTTSSSRKRNKPTFFHRCGGIDSSRFSFQIPEPTGGMPPPAPCEPITTESDLLCHEALDGIRVGAAEGATTDRHGGERHLSTSHQLLVEMASGAREDRIHRPPKMQRLDIEPPSYDALSRMGQVRSCRSRPTPGSAPVGPAHAAPPYPLHPPRPAAPRGMVWGSHARLWGSHAAIEPIAMIEPAGQAVSVWR